jgi:exosortase H (IPTLxxWG-CTERM-specific)
LVLAVAGLVLWLGFRDEVLGPVLVLWRIEVAKATEALIHWAGMEATREASALYHPGGFAYQISRGCTGFVPAALLTAAVAAYPAAGRRKLVGLLLGVPALLAVNLARLVHLYYLGVHQPRWFEVAHRVVWEGIIVLAVLALWVAWTMWADRAKRPYRSVSQRSSSTSTIEV